MTDLCDFACPHGAWCTFPSGHTASQHRVEACRCNEKPTYQGAGSHGRKVVQCTARDVLRASGICGDVADSPDGRACVLAIGHDDNRHEPATAAWNHPSVKAQTHELIAAVADWASTVALERRVLSRNEKVLLKRFVALSTACAREVPESQTHNSRGDVVPPPPERTSYTSDGIWHPSPSMPGYLDHCKTCDQCAGEYGRANPRDCGGNELDCKSANCSTHGSPFAGRG